MGYPQRKNNRPAPNVQRQAEKLEALVADRGTTQESGRTDQRAVTRADVAGQGMVELQAVMLSGAPTAADYNKLVSDQRALAALLNKLGADFRWTV